MIEEMVISAVLTGLSVFIGSYVMMQITIKQAKKQVKTELEAWLNSENGQKAIFSIGALIGNGAVKGTGLSIPRGKGGLEGLIMQIAGEYIKSKFPSEPQKTY